MTSTSRNIGLKLVADHDQRERIEQDLYRCFLVEAGAGGGKTDRLVARMIALLAAGVCTVNRLAAITFTRKAAAELRARFQIALERAVRESTGERRQRLATALPQVEQVVIATIHSFCARLLRERPVEAGVDVAFEEIDEATDRRFRQQAWDLFVADLHDRQDPMLKELEDLGLEIGQLADSFRRFASYPDVQCWPAPPATLPDQGPVVAALKNYAAHMHRLNEELPADPGNDRLMEAYQDIPQMVRQADMERPASVLEILERFSELDIRKVVQKNWPDGPAQAKSELGRWNQFVAQHAAACVSSWQAMRYELVLRILHGARTVYDGLRRDAGCLNYQDLLLRAAALLRDHAEVRHYFHSRFTHLLVDEFQDTDPVQAEIMLLLTSDDPDQSDWRRCRPLAGSLFIVGDPKQSIFRFRRADIVTYNQVKDIIVAGGGEVLVLSTNFRSQAGLVDWINRTFAHVFPSTVRPEMPAAGPMATGREDAVKGELSGLYLLLAPDDRSDKRSISEHEADLLARTIRHALDAGVTVPRTAKDLQQGISHRALPGDFLIITRNTSQLSLYARKLQEYHIPYQMTGGSAWEEAPELTLLALCLRAVTLPDDAIFLVAVLRSELFGFSDRDLYALARASGRFSYWATLPDGLATETMARYRDAFQRLQRYSRWLAQIPPVAAVEKIVADLGLAARAAMVVGGNGQAGTLAKALEVLRAAQARLPSVTELMNHLDELIQSRDRFNGIPVRPHDGSVVRLMNLHQVKGLEAPVVFLADPSGAYEHPIDLHIDRSGPEVTGYLAVLDKNLGYQPRLLACPPDWECLVEVERQFRLAEEQRLLYVAATRPGTQLTISQRSRWRQRNPWQFFEPHLDGCPKLPDPGPVVVATDSTVTATPTDVFEASAAIAARWTAALAPTYARTAVKKLALAGSAAVSAGSDIGVEWGTVLHQLLQVALVRPGSDLPRLAAQHLAEQGLDPALADPAMKTVKAVMQSAIWQRALASPQRFVEVPFQVLRPGAGAMATLPTILSGVIDLVFLEDGGWVVVDWKTDAIPAAKLSQLVAKYRLQVVAYAETWLELAGGAVKETGLYLTHLGRYVTV